MAAAGYFDRPIIQNNPIYRLLITSTAGKSVLTAYEKRGFLTKTTRNELCRQILQDAINKAFERVFRIQGVRTLDAWKVSREQFITWSLQIKELFKGEKQETYYRPFVYFEKERINADGKLLRHYEYLLKKYRKLGLLKPSARAPDLDDELEPISDEVEESFAWLKENTDPADQTKHHWDQSFQLRQRKLAQGCTVDNYFENLPCLKLNIGVDLLFSDFRKIFPEAGNFFARWDQARATLIQQLQFCKSIPLRDSAYLRELPGLMRHNADAVILYLLPFLIDPPAPKRKLGEKKITSSERQEAFFVHVEAEAEISNILSRMKAATEEKQGNFPPTLILVGPITNLDAVYVSINDFSDDVEQCTFYKVDSILHGVDLLFKVCTALQCKKILRAQQIWLFIQRGLYKIRLKGDRCNDSVNILLGLIEPVTVEEA